LVDGKIVRFPRGRKAFEAKVPVYLHRPYLNRNAGRKAVKAGKKEGRKEGDVVRDTPG
jgi:hypothetical protein